MRGDRIFLQATGKRDGKGMNRVKHRSTNGSRYKWVKKKNLERVSKD